MRIGQWPSFPKRPGILYAMLMLYVPLPLFSPSSRICLLEQKKVWECTLCTNAYWSAAHSSLYAIHAAFWFANAGVFLAQKRRSLKEAMTFHTFCAVVCTAESAHAMHIHFEEKIILCWFLFFSVMYGGSIKQHQIRIQRCGIRCVTYKMPMRCYLQIKKHRK